MQVVTAPATVQTSTASLAATLLTVSTSLQRWDSELQTLTSLERPTRAQSSKIPHLRASIDIFESFLYDGVDENSVLPTSKSIDCANA